MSGNPIDIYLKPESHRDGKSPEITKDARNYLTNLIIGKKPR